MYSNLLKTLLETDVQVSIFPVHESQDYLRLEWKKQLDDDTWFTATFKSMNPSDLVDQWDAFRQVALWLEKQADHANDIVMSEERGVELFCPAYLSWLGQDFSNILKGRASSESIESSIKDRLVNGPARLHVVRVNRFEVHFFIREDLTRLQVLPEMSDADGYPLLHIGDQFHLDDAQLLVQNRIIAGNIVKGVQVFIDAYTVAQ